MDSRLARSLQIARDQYDYPWAAVTAGPGPIALASGISGQFDDRPTAVTDLPLDDHHHRLLNSPRDADIRQGCGSVIYWGFRTYSDQFAQRRARLFFSHVTATASHVAGLVRRAGSHCFSGDWGLSLKRIGQLPQLSQLPFASKVIAFLAPVDAGVYDNRINRFIITSGLDVPMLGRQAVAVNQRGSMVYAAVAGAANQEIYQRWCERLQGLRDSLNALGLSYQWTCPAGSKQNWRAIDVERALFRLTQGDELQAFPMTLNDVIKKLKDHCSQHPI